MRFNLLKLLVILTVAALAIAFGLHTSLLPFLIFFAIPMILASLCAAGVNKFQMFVANRLTPYLYPRGLFGVLRWACGRTGATWGLCNHAASLLANKNLDAAIEAYTQLLKHDSSPAHYWAGRGAAHYNALHLIEAERDLTEALARDSEYEIALMYRGYTRFALSKFQAAIDDLERVPCKNFARLEIALYRGHAHAQLGHWTEARRDYLLAYDLNPAQADAAIALARLQACCPLDAIRDGVKAIENAYQGCVRTEWNDWVALSVLAAAHAEAGDFEKAIQFAEHALRQAPENEKPERQKRIEQFRAGIPFRISLAAQSHGNVPEAQCEIGTR